MVDSSNRDCMTGCHNVLVFFLLRVVGSSVNRAVKRIINAY